MVGRDTGVTTSATVRSKPDAIRFLLLRHTGWMHSSERDSSNPWPHGMTITVEEASSSLMFLLFVRSVWALGSAGHPGLDPVPAAGDSRRPVNIDAHTLDIRWSAAWADAVADLPGARNTRPVDAETRARYDRMSFEELSAVGDPRRSGVFAIGVDVEALGTWEMGVRAALPRPTTLADEPERVNLAELVPAWRAGLRTIVALPFDVEWARRVSPTYLLISTSARWDRGAYGQALALTPA